MKDRYFSLTNQITVESKELMSSIVFMFTHTVYFITLPHLLLNFLLLPVSVIRPVWSPASLQLQKHLGIPLVGTPGYLVHHLSTITIIIIIIIL